MVTAEDGYGNVDPTYHGSVALALGRKMAGRGHARRHDDGHRPVSNGVATFTGLTLDEAAGGYTLQVAGGSGRATATTSRSLTVTPGAATLLLVTYHLFLEPPGRRRRRRPATAEDGHGNVDPTYNGTVTLAVREQPRPAGPGLGGTATGTASGGVATFAGLSLDKAAAGYTLQVSGGTIQCRHWRHHGDPGRAGEIDGSDRAARQPDRRRRFRPDGRYRRSVWEPHCVQR